ncbi:MAG: ABC transporter substrate-binding protein [Candidatus Doudnabacteria bacterium]
MSNLWLQLKTFFQSLQVGLISVPNLKRRQIPDILENIYKKEFYIFTAALLIFIFSGGFLLFQAFQFQGSGPRSGGELVEGLVGEPQFINPVLSETSGVDMDISRLVYGQLLKFDDQEKLTPDLAAALPQISQDQKTYTLNLKPNLKWQDGHALNADDILFTIQTIQNGDYQSPLRPNWARVKVAKVDDLTLTFVLHEVSASFASNFALGILPKHVWAGISAQNFRLTDYNLKPVGSGPFAVSEIKKTSDGTIKSVSLRANDKYYQGRPYLNQITFKFYDGYDSLIGAYQAKDIQSLGVVPFDQKAFLGTSDRMKANRINLPQYQAVFFNLPKNSTLNEKAVRQALWLATDRGSIIKDVYLGNAAPAYGPILEGSLGYNPSIAKSAHTNLEEAAGILNKAGWILDPATNIRYKNSAKGGSASGGKKTLEFSLATTSNLVINVKAAQILQNQWAAIGVKVNLIIVNSYDLESQYIRPRAFDALLFSENVGADPDPFPFWHSSQSRDPGLNLSGFTNAEADKLLTEARQTSDPSIRTRDYLRFQEIINDQLPALFLVRSLYIYNVPKNLQGINLTDIIHPSERFLDVNRWYFQN